jgi:hypothetical protein
MVAAVAAAAALACTPQPGLGAGPLVDLGHEDGYYGHQNWWATMRWSLAARP